jgi:hypothetical protein
VRWLSRIGTSVLVLGVGVLASALTLGLFPRTLTGLALLIFPGLPIALFLECLGELALSKHPGRGRDAASLAGLLVLLGGLWWWLGTHNDFVHRHFLG